MRESTLYLGQSKRQFGTHLKEHQKAVSTLSKGKSEHVCNIKHVIDNRHGQRRCLEAWHINLGNHAWLGMVVLICHKNTIMLLADDVIPWIYEKPRCDFRSPLTKTLDWSIEMLGRECYSTAWALHKFIKTRVATETMTDYTWLWWTHKL
jgi:hypothetical protein